jgi:glycosyltransferase involved in cell wall biosynthesis
LWKQSKPPDEIIVVDNNSEDETAEIAERCGARVVSIAGRGVHRARDLGTKMASGDLVVSTDADVVAPQDWLEKIVGRFKHDPELVGLTGTCHDLHGRFPEQVAARLAGRLFQGLGGNTAFRRSAYDKTCGYQKTIFLWQGEDVLFWNELKRAGKCVFDPSIWVWHDCGGKWAAAGTAVVCAAVAGLALMSFSL